MSKILEYQEQRRKLAEEDRNCLSCNKPMVCVRFQSHPICEQVWQDWKCQFCGEELKLSYFDDWIEKRIIVTIR